MQMEQPGTDLPPALGIARAWQTTVFLGVITLILGLIVAFRPSTSLNVIAVLIGLLMIISGIFHLIRVFDSAESHRVWLGIAGLGPPASRKRFVPAGNVPGRSPSLSRRSAASCWALTATVSKS